MMRPRHLPRSATRLWPLLLGVTVLNFTPYCYQATYVDYQFKVSGEGLGSFTFPDSARDGSWILTADDSNRWARCAGFRPYTLLLHHHGNDDVGASGVYVGFDHRSPPMLHVVISFDAEHTRIPDAWAPEAAQLFTQASPLRPVTPPDSVAVMGKGAQFKEWCKRAQ